MKKISFVFLLFCSIYANAQKTLSFVNDQDKKEIIQLLRDNKKNADFPYVYDDLNDSTQILRITNAGIVVMSKDSVDFSLNLLSHLRIDDQDDYLFYNKQKDGSYKLVGMYTANFPRIGIQLGPALGFRNTYLDEVAKYYDITKISLYNIYGVGVCVKDGDEMWIIEGNKRTDLKTWVKSQYRTLGEFRNLLLFKDNVNPFGSR